MTKVLLIHGACSGPWAFEGWEDSFLPEARLLPVDLQEGLEVGAATMEDYVERVVIAAGGIHDRPVLVGWSMGGLVAMMAAPRLRASRLVLIEPSPPIEIVGAHPEVEIPASGSYGAEVYGGLSGLLERPESAVARAQRQRGISIPELPFRTLVVSGDDFPEVRGSLLAARYHADEMYYAGHDHVRLVRARKVRRAIAGWLGFGLKSAAKVARDRSRKPAGRRPGR